MAHELHKSRSMVQVHSGFVDYDDNCKLAFQQHGIPEGRGGERGSIEHIVILFVLSRACVPKTTKGRDM